MRRAWQSRRMFLEGKLARTNERKSMFSFCSRSSKRSTVDSQFHGFPNLYDRPAGSQLISSNRLSMDDTDNEDLDTFSDFNSIRYNQKTVRTSPSMDDDSTQTDSRLLSSSGYQSLNQSQRFLSPSCTYLLKSHSENDLQRLLLNEPTDNQLVLRTRCPNCFCPSPTVTVIPPANALASSPSTSWRISTLNIFQQPLGLMLIKYLNLILISKNVFLLPLFIFLLRQRSINLGH